MQCAMGAPLTGRHQESGSFRATGCRKSGVMLPSYGMLWSFTSCPGSNHEVLIGRVPSVGFFLLHADFLSTVPILKSWPKKDLNKVAELGSIFKRPSCFLKSKCFPLDPRQGPLPCPLSPWKLFTSDYFGSISGKSGATLQQPRQKWWFVWWIKPQNRPTCLFFWRLDGRMGICQVIACGLRTTNCQPSWYMILANPYHKMAMDYLQMVIRPKRNQHCIILVMQ